MGKDYNGIGGGKYKSSNSKKGASKRAVEVTPQSSLEEMKLVVRVSKKASDSGAEYHFTFDLEELEIDIDTAKLSKLFNKDDIYERDYVEVYEDEESEEEDDNPYRLIFQDEDGEYEDIDGDVLIKDLLEGGEVIITLK
ncbi:hypothetical protein GGI19_006845 [Coemansia pectinata]|uniref:Uncharacterized protein n=1 Tax=Coemansia pectinata TaxID=1052879 RepID=A0A9W8L766_9FUNG|nr:hypothetical protein GGI19_006845 [Coemansia pectinata]